MVDRVRLDGTGPILDRTLTRACVRAAVGGVAWRISEHGINLVRERCLGGGALTDIIGRRRA
jgi:hypothetical protein